MVCFTNFPLQVAIDNNAEYLLDRSFVFCSTSECEVPSFKIETLVVRIELGTNKSPVHTNRSRNWRQPKHLSHRTKNYT